MLSIFKKFIHSFAEKPAIWFFYVFLATSTLSVRKVLFFYPINGFFNEYTGIYIYLSDIFLFLTIIAWLFILCNKYINLSTLSSALLAFNKKCSTWNILSNAKTIKNVPRGTFFWLKKTYPQIVHNYAIIFPLPLVIFSFLSIQWSINHQVAFFRSAKLLSMILLFYFVFKNVPRGTFLKRLLQITITVSLIQAIIGIGQFIIQRSIGLLCLKESIISPQIAGVAKVIFDGHTYIRAYGLFPHPNILGGFLVFSTILTLLYFKMFHVEHLYWNGKFRLKWNTIMRLTLLIQGTALFLTFSKSAIFGLLIAFFYLFIKKCSSSSMRNVPRGTLRSWTNTIKMFHVEHFYRKLFLTISIVFLLFFILKPDTYSILFKSFDERDFYLNVSRGTFLSSPFFGIGSGQFVFSMQNIAGLQQWQFQPVHNVFLLILNELGLFALFVFLFFIFKLFSVRPIEKKCSTWNILSKNNESLNVPRGTFYESFASGGRGMSIEKPGTDISVYLKSVLLSFIFIMFFDHYFWDIQQGQILVWMLFGLIAGVSTKR